MPWKGPISCTAASVPPPPWPRPPRRSRSSRNSLPSLPSASSRCGWDGVPKESGSATGPPAPRSLSFRSSIGAFCGAKKSLAASWPEASSPIRTTESPRYPGGWSPGPAGGGSPLLVVRNIRGLPSGPEPSLASPPPDCQIPPPDPPVGLDVRLAGHPHRQHPPPPGAEVAVRPEGDVYGAVGQQQAGPLLLVVRRERHPRVVVGGALQEHRVAGPLGPVGRADRVQVPVRLVRRRTVGNLRGEVDGVRGRVVHRRGGLADIRGQVGAPDRRGLERGAERPGPADGPRAGIQAVRRGALGGDEHGAVDDQRLRVDTAVQRHVELRAEFPRAHLGRRQAGLGSVPSGPLRIDRHRPLVGRRQARSGNQFGRRRAYQHGTGHQPARHRRTHLPPASSSRSQKTTWS